MPKKNDPNSIDTTTDDKKPSTMLKRVTKVIANKSGEMTKTLHLTREVPIPPKTGLQRISEKLYEQTKSVLNPYDLSSGESSNESDEENEAFVRPSSVELSGNQSSSDEGGLGTNQQSITKKVPHSAANKTKNTSALSRTVTDVWDTSSPTTKLGRNINFRGKQQETVSSSDESDIESDSGHKNANIKFVAPYEQQQVIPLRPFLYQVGNNKESYLLVVDSAAFEGGGNWNRIRPLLENAAALQQHRFFNLFSQDSGVGSHNEQPFLRLSNMDECIFTPVVVDEKTYWILTDLIPRRVDGRNKGKTTGADLVAKFNTKLAANYRENLRQRLTVGNHKIEWVNPQENNPRLLALRDLLPREFTILKLVGRHPGVQPEHRNTYIQNVVARYQEAVRDGECIYQIELVTSRSDLRQAGETRSLTEEVRIALRAALGNRCNGLTPEIIGYKTNIKVSTAGTLLTKGIKDNDPELC